MSDPVDWKAWLVTRCRSEAESVRGVFPSIGDALDEAADALEAAEAELARLEHQLQQAEEATTAAYKDAEAAEAKLAAIDALHWRTTEYPEMGNFAWCYGCSHEWPCPTHRILHPEEER